eukprot:210678_1
MTELVPNYTILEPAPMLDDGDDYGGPIRHVDDENDNNDDLDHLNANAESDIDLNDNAGSLDMDIDIDMGSNEDGLHMHKPSHQNESGNALLVADNSATSGGAGINPRGQSIPRATAGGLIGEENHEEEEAPVVDNAWEDEDDTNTLPLRVGPKPCCSDCYARFYAYPRLRIFLSFGYLLLSLMLVCADLFGALFIGNEIWNFNHKYAHTQYHELWFGTLMVLIAAPFFILWAAHLIFIEEQISKQRQSSHCKCIKYVLMSCYLFTPIGILSLLIYEFIYIYLYQMIVLLFYRFLCGKPSYKMVMNKKKTKGSRAYLRFRKIIHMMSSSIPLMILYGVLWYFDPYPRLRWKFLIAATFVSGLNSLFTILSFLTDAKSVNIPLTQYVVLSFRLFGGFIPKLRAIQNGKIRRINYSSFAFGNYTYAKFADVIESDASKLETIILTRSTLSDLSVSLCYQLGAVCAAKNINIIILKNYTPFVVWFKYLFPSKRPYKVTLIELKQAFRTCDIFNDAAEVQFDQLEHELERLYGETNNDKSYYYSDFVCDWNGFVDENNYNHTVLLKQRGRLGIFDGLLRILPPHIVDKNNKHTFEDRKVDERLLNLVLGTGTINEIDPNNKTSALFYAIIQNDYDLIDRLTAHGATITSKDEWQRMGNYINQLAKDNNQNDLNVLLRLIKDKKEIECDLTYHDIDGRNAVMYAAMNGNLDICKLLLGCGLGADILHLDQDGNTAADLAKQYNHTHVEKYLKDQFL